MNADNPFNHLNNLPDRMATAVAALCAWLVLGTLLLRFAPGPVNWIGATLVLVHAIRTWLRFVRRRRLHH